MMVTSFKLTVKIILNYIFKLYFIRFCSMASQKKCHFEGLLFEFLNGQQKMLKHRVN